MSHQTPPTATTDKLRQQLRDAYLADETQVINHALAIADMDHATRAAISARAVRLVQRIRGDSGSGLMESFLAEYGLSSAEGIALMCLAEAMLRVPDEPTLDALIHDKIAPADWGLHLGRSSSSLVNASTWALLVTGQVLDDGGVSGLVGNVRAIVRRLGEPLVREAVSQAMRLLGSQFVLGANIADALERAADAQAQGYTYSYDMLGEAARTAADADRYHAAYAAAINAIAGHAHGANLRTNPGISVKLSALHPRYEFSQRTRAVPALIDRMRSLCGQAAAAGIGLNIDAEEAERLDLSLDIVTALLAAPELDGWDGLGVVVQAYGRRALPLLDWLHASAVGHGRRIMVRLVKGAYWDAEIKRAQVLGLESFPVFTRKVNTDISYLACARRLLALTAHIYPQFATHNAHTAAAVAELAGQAGVNADAFEFQRLHGMGEELFEALVQEHVCRIYAPVGPHRDLLAYLVRRLLENGANSSFVHQLADVRIAPEVIARDPVGELESLHAVGRPTASRRIATPQALYADRRNARGWDLSDPLTVAELDGQRDMFRTHRWRAEPVLAGESTVADRPEATSCHNPARPDDIVGSVVGATPADVAVAVAAAAGAFAAWNTQPLEPRARCLEQLANLYESNAPELFALLTREAGKTLPDAVAEVREAVDFCRYYAAQATAMSAGTVCGRGVFACISPWNFPLAIFTGQVAAALVTGNCVVAKPAEQTPLIAARAVALMYEAGIPPEVIALLPGDGPTVGAALVADPGIAGVCFTGSTETAGLINRSMAARLAPDAPLIAETGGVNAMLVDSTALPEQAVRDILASAFASAGQRCSALRMLYLQADVADHILAMLEGALHTLRLGDPWALDTDIGPLIDADARQAVTAHCRALTAAGARVAHIQAPADGLFVAPHVFRVGGIEALEREVFGPVLHVATFEADELPDVVTAINARGYGLTLGLHTRIDDRVEQVVEHARVGNQYVNRNQIGAVVGSQPFGGEGLSGTGPKAGGPHYLRRFCAAPDPVTDAEDATTPDAATVDALTAQPLIDVLDVATWSRRTDRKDTLHSALEGVPADTTALEQTLATCGLDQLEPRDLPGPTGESNRLTCHPRGVVLCLGSGAQVALQQALVALATGNGALLVAPGASHLTAALQRRGVPVAAVDGELAVAALPALTGIGAVAARGPAPHLTGLRQALAERDGALIPLVTTLADASRYVLERTLCIDTTAAGGNATLLAGDET